MAGPVSPQLMTSRPSTLQRRLPSTIRRSSTIHPARPVHPRASPMPPARCGSGKTPRSTGWICTREDRIWCTADTGWSKAGTSILFGPWSRGTAVLFYDGPFEPAKRFELLAKHRITCFCAAATELRRLVLEDAAPHDLSRLRQTVSAGESVNPEILTRWQELIGMSILDGYGQTETLMTITNRPGRTVKAGSMGPAAARGGDRSAHRRRGSQGSRGVGRTADRAPQSPDHAGVLGRSHAHCSYPPGD